MLGLVTEIGFSLISNMLQIVLGCIMAFLILLLLKKRRAGTTGIFNDTILITVLSVCGAILPISAYGLVPVTAALLAVGFRFYTVLPMIISNAFFNLLVPFNDPGFIWRTGVRRVILALFAGMLAGMLLRIIGTKEKSIFKAHYIPGLGKESGKPPGLLHIVSINMNILGIYLILGVVSDVIFHKYVLWSIMDLFYINAYTASIPRFFAGYDVANPFFLLAMNIAYLLMDLTKISALSAILLPKGLVLYIGYWVMLAVLLSTSAFI